AAAGSRAASSRPSPCRACTPRRCRPPSGRRRRGTAARSCAPPSPPPSRDLRPRSQPAPEQGFPRVFLRQIEADRDRLRENEVAIDEDRQLSRRVQGEKLGGPNLA